MAKKEGKIIDRSIILPEEIVDITEDLDLYEEKDGIIPDEDTRVEKDKDENVIVEELQEINPALDDSLKGEFATPERKASASDITGGVQDEEVCLKSEKEDPVSEKLSLAVNDKDSFDKSKLEGEELPKDLYNISRPDKPVRSLWIGSRLFVASLFGLLVILFGIVYFLTKPNNQMHLFEFDSGLMFHKVFSRYDKQIPKEVKPVVFSEQTETFVFYLDNVPKPFLIHVKIRVKIPRGEKSAAYTSIYFRDYLYRRIRKIPFYNEDFSKLNLSLPEQIKRIISEWRGTPPVHFVAVSDIEVL